jgi:hypothetical protein
MGTVRHVFRGAKLAIAALGAIEGLVGLAIIILGLFRSNLPYLFALSEFIILILLMCLLAGVIAWLSNTLKQTTRPVIRSFNFPLAKDFVGLNLRKIIDAPKECLVIVGAQTPHGFLKGAGVEEDWKSARLLCEKFGLPGPKSDTELTEDERVSKDIIAIGGPMVNEVTSQANAYLPIRVGETSLDGITVKVIVSFSGNDYKEREYGVIEAIPSIYNNRRMMIFAFGLHREGSQVAVSALVENYPEACKKNIFNEKFPARVVRRTNSNKTSKIEFVE